MNVAFNKSFCLFYRVSVHENLNGFILRKYRIEKRGEQSKYVNTCVSNLRNECMFSIKGRFSSDRGVSL